MRRVITSNDETIRERALRAFSQLSVEQPAGIAFAPGRVNLIGEHTDYNDGFVLPMAIEDGIAAAFSWRSDGVLRIHASDLGETREIALTALPGAQESTRGWFRYAAGVAWSMQAAGLPLVGADIATAATLPSGAGLSSSAAFELVIARALSAAGDFPWAPREAARICQRAEHRFGGVACGIMDQMAVACARTGCALLLDCRSLETTDIAMPGSARVVVMNTGVQRVLASTAYNDRRAACERAVAAVRRRRPEVRALRDVDIDLLRRARPDMDETAFRRASHVVEEIVRPRRLADALESGDLAEAGRLMAESHASLRDLYEVSCAELDALVDASSARPGCHGARLTGAGFGGCAIALVDADGVDAFAAHVADAYATATGRHATITVSGAASGARLLTRHDDRS